MVHSVTGSLNQNILIVSLLLGLYYIVAMTIYCHTFQWSFFNSLSATTVNLTLFGKITYSPELHVRLGSLLEVTGRVLSVVMLVNFILLEMSSAQENIVAMKRTSPVELHHKFTKIMQRRVALPLGQVMAVVLIGACFFAHTEYWSTSEALCYAVMHHLSIETVAWPNHSLSVRRGSSQLFLVGYMWIFSLSVMQVVSNACAFFIERQNYINYRNITSKMIDWSASIECEGGLSADSPGSLSCHETLVNLLVHMEVLDKSSDVDRWMDIIQDFSTQDGVIGNRDMKRLAQYLKSSTTLHQTHQEDTPLRAMRVGTTSLNWPLHSQDALRTSYHTVPERDNRSL